MNRTFHRRVIVALISLMWFSSASGQAQVLQGADEFGYLTIGQVETGFIVKVDGVVVGKTPIIDLRLLRGEHSLEIIYGQTAAWQRSTSNQIIYITTGDTLRLDIPRLKTYFIQSTPFGAAVYLDDQKIGETPLYVELPTAGGCMLRFEKKGYLTTHIKCDSGTDASIQVNLRENKEFELLDQRDRVTFDLGRASNRKKSIILVGVGIATGVAAVMLKRRADSYYDQYLRAPTPSRQNALFDKTANYDTYSSVAFGVFQVSFGAGFYYFLKSND